MPEPAPDRPPDYFDRLLARQMPIADAGRTRPRLPGPFERAEARWTETLLPEEPASPTAAYPAPEPAGPPPVGPIRVERHTEIRTGPPVPAPPLEPPAPNPRWITRPAPDSASVSTPASGERPTSSGPVPAHRPAAVRPAPVRPTAEPAAPARPTPAGPAVPRSTPSPAARRATAPPPAPRRRTRPAEPAVHIRIGRLEVRAGGAPAPVTTPRAARPAPAVSLSDYLSGSVPRAEGRR